MNLLEKLMDTTDDEQKKSLIIEHLNYHKDKAFDNIKKKLAYKMTGSLLNESGQIITSVDYRGGRVKNLQRKHGYAREGFHYVPLSASEKMAKRFAAKKRLRTIAAKGSGFKRRVALHMKLAWRKRKQFGLSSAT